MGVKLNNAENYEPIEITISKETTPIAYNNKIQELVEQGAYLTIARKNSFVISEFFKM